MPSDYSPSYKSGIFHKQDTHQESSRSLVNCCISPSAPSVRSAGQESVPPSPGADLYLQGGSEVAESEAGQSAAALTRPPVAPAQVTEAFSGTDDDDGDDAQNLGEEWNVNRFPVANYRCTSGPHINRFLVLSNVIRTHSKEKEARDQAKNVLLIGGDLLISKSDYLPEKNDNSNTNKLPEECGSNSLLSESAYNSLTIKTINYKCRVLQEHSRLCACGTPRLHVYLSGSHRCNSECVAAQTPAAGLPATHHHVLSVCHTPEMTGRSRGRSRGRKTAVPQKLSRKPRHSYEPVRQKGNSQRETVLARGHLGTSVVGSHENDEPESELLVEGECEWLPTTMGTLGGVEYIVLDDDTLNLGATTDGIISSDTLKSKINNIYEDIDDKSEVCITESKSPVIKEVKARSVSVRRGSEPSSQWTGGRGCLGEEEEDGGYEETLDQTTDDMGSSSLAGVCTNHCPSIKDIFGDVNIKEEPLEDIKQDMSIEDFSKEISKASNEDNKNSNDLFIQKKEEESDESSSNGLFAKLIKEEDMDSDGNSSDDSLAPLQIDEERFMPPLEDINAPLKETTELCMPSVNIISPFKIKILLGSPPSREAHHVPRNGVESGTSTPAFSLGTPVAERNVVTAARRGRRGCRKTILITTPVTDTTTVPTPGNVAGTIKSFTCNYCNTHCPNDQALAEHFENHQKDGLIICYFCQKSFGDKTGMKRHMRTHTGEKPYQCKVCGKRFSLPGNFKKHRDIHEDRRTEPCTVCGKTFRRKEHLKYHMRTHTGEKPYTCSECGTSFTARYSLQIHMNIHLGKKPYKCTYCSKAFSDKSTMRKHVRVHTGEKPFRCQECRRCFGESGTLAAHMATHRSDRPYQCDKCDLRFKTTGGLRQHEKVHTGDKQFACKYCGMKFLQKYNMTMHERIHTGEKPYTCSHCERSFRSRSCLAKHVVLHGGDDERRFGCDHCSSRFYRKAHLRRHIDMHLGIKNYECNICTKKFCTRGTLKSHLKTFHSHGARRFPCNWCGRVFKRKIYVTTHVCTWNPIKIEEDGDEILDGEIRGELKDTASYNSSDSDDASSVEVKSEPEDDLMEGEIIEGIEYDFDNTKEKEDLNLVAGNNLTFHQLTSQNIS